MKKKDMDFCLLICIVFWLLVYNRKKDSYLYLCVDHVSDVKVERSTKNQDIYTYTSFYNIRGIAMNSEILVSLIRIDHHLKDNI